MKTNYGNTFNTTSTEYAVSVETIWVRADVFYPCGVFIPCDTTNTAGTKIPAGTPVGVDKIGGTVTFGSAATTPVGLTYEDAYVGTDGCSLTIVTNGTINESVSSATVTAAQKGKLPGITFVKEA